MNHCQEMEKQNCENSMTSSTGQPKEIVQHADRRIANALLRSGDCVHRLINKLDEGQNYFCLLCILKLFTPFDPFKHYIKLPKCFPRKSIMLAFATDFPDAALREINNHICDYINTQQLNVDNVHEVFQILLEIEDQTILAEHVTLVQNSVKLLRETRHVYSFELNPDSGAKISDMVVPQLTEVVLVYCKNDAIMSQQMALKIIQERSLDQLRKQTKVGLVETVSLNRVSFKFEAELSRRSKYTVIFVPHRSPIRCQHYALQLLGGEEDMRRYLFPQTLSAAAPTEQCLVNVDLNLFNATIANNAEQLQAVRSIVAGPSVSAPFVIFGPPGTGKTTTIVESMLQLRLRQRGSRILVAAGSNSACDTIALLLCEYFERNPTLDMLESGLLRIYSRSALEKGIYATTLRKHSNYRDGNTSIPDVAAIHVHGIVVATISVVGKLVAGHVGACDHFTHVFIDEAGALTEPETLIAIMGIKSEHCHVILSGDHKQLGPVLKSKRAAALGLQRSMLERLLDSDCYAVDANGGYDKTVQVRLRRNYRSHPEIVRLFNHLYYNNELIAEANGDINAYRAWKFLANPNFPIIFQAVHGITDKFVETPSSCNDLEVEVLLWYVRQLLVVGVGGHRVSQSDIGIITPYKLQNNRISALLRRHGWSAIEAGSVEQFQGREKPIIIVSLVRSFAGLGFVQHPRRLNVILSRAKSLLILIGNPHTLASNRDFKFIIDECTAQGTLRRKRRPLAARTATAGTTVENRPVTAVATAAASNAAQTAAAVRPLLSDDEKILLARIAKNIAVEKQRLGRINTNFIRLTVLELTLRNRSVPLSALMDHPKSIILNEMCKSLCHHQRYMKLQLLSANNNSNANNNSTAQRTTASERRNLSISQADWNPLNPSAFLSFNACHLDYGNNDQLRDIHKDILEIVEGAEPSNSLFVHSK